MSAAGNMTMRARVQRNSDTGTDSFGHPAKPNFLARNSIPCNVFSKMRDHVTDEDKVVHIEDIRGKFETGADLLEEDQISDVVDRRGQVLFAGPLNVVNLVRRRGHVEATLERFV